MDHRKLVELITGDPYYLSAVRECGRCRGNGRVEMLDHCPECKGADGKCRGVVFREWRECDVCGGKGHLREFQYAAEINDSSLCPECKGSNRVPDTEGREIIAEAVERWEYDKHGFPHPLSTTATYIQFWGNRHGQSYQGPLEDHVRDYHRPVPDLSSPEGCTWLKGLLREKSHAYITGWQSEFFADVNTASTSNHPTEPAACEAAFAEERTT